MRDQIAAFRQEYGVESPAELTVDRTKTNCSPDPERVGRAGRAKPSANGKPRDATSRSQTPLYRSQTPRNLSTLTAAVEHRTCSVPVTEGGRTVGTAVISWTARSTSIDRDSRLIHQYRAACDGGGEVLSRWQFQSLLICSVAASNSTSFSLFSADFREAWVGN